MENETTGSVSKEHRTNFFAKTTKKLGNVKFFFDNLFVEYLIFYELQGKSSTMLYAFQ